jgi:tRNA(Ile)-lysidine synthase TilS/MesJ
VKCGHVKWNFDRSNYGDTGESNRLRCGMNGCSCDDHRRVILGFYSSHVTAELVQNANLYHAMYLTKMSRELRR